MTAFGYLASSIPLRLAVTGSTVAIPILATQELGNVALGGGLVAAFLAPSVLAAPLVGAILDRTRHPRRWMIASAALTASAFLLTGFLGLVPTPLVAVVLVLAGLATPFSQGGMSSFVTEEIPDERKAYGYDALSYNVGSVGGPALVALAGLGHATRLAIWVLVGAALLGAVAFLATHLRPRPAAVHPSVLSAIAAGTRHLVRHRPLTVVTASGTLSQLGAGGLPIAAVALSVQRAGTPDDAATIVTAFAIGGLVGALLEAARPSARFSAAVVMGGGFAATGVATLFAAIDFGLWWSVVAIGISGLFTASSAAAMLLLRKQQSPPEVRSQVFTVGAGLRATASAVGAAVAGVLAGLDASVLVGLVGLVWVLSGLLLLAYPRGVRPLDAPTVVVAD